MLVAFDEDADALADLEDTGRVRSAVSSDEEERLEQPAFSVASSPITARMIAQHALEGAKKKSFFPRYCSFPHALARIVAVSRRGPIFDCLWSTNCLESFTRAIQEANVQHFPELSTERLVHEPLRWARVLREVPSEDASDTALRTTLSGRIMKHKMVLDVLCEATIASLPRGFSNRLPVLLACGVQAFFEWKSTVPAVSLMGSLTIASERCALADV